MPYFILILLMFDLALHVPRLTLLSECRWSSWWRVLVVFIILYQPLLPSMLAIGWHNIFTMRVLTNLTWNAWVCFDLCPPVARLPQTLFAILLQCEIMQDNPHYDVNITGVQCTPRWFARVWARILNLTWLFVQERFVFCRVNLHATLSR